MPTEDPQALPLLEALHSAPSRRYLSAEPIGDDVVHAILDAAVRGPSGGNSQRWAWIVVRDAQIKAQIAEWYREGWNAGYGSRRADFEKGEGGTMNVASFRAGDHLANTLQDA